MITISYKDFSHHLVVVYYMPVIFVSNLSVLLMPYPSKILVIVVEHFCSACACNRYATTIGELKQMLLQFSELLGLVTPEVILTHECRFLHVVFYMAERAWSHAMEKKTAGPNAPQRIYMLGRFRKAVKWAALFSQLCSIKGDSRTSLEAEVCFLSFV